MNNKFVKYNTERYFAFLECEIFQFRIIFNTLTRNDNKHLQFSCHAGVKLCWTKIPKLFIVYNIQSEGLTL